MIAWWQRLFFSLMSVLVATLVCLGIAFAADALFRRSSIEVRSSEAVVTIAVAVGFSMVAWFVSTPAVLIVKNFQGARFWVYLVMGSLVGPLMMLALFAAVYLLVPHQPGQSWFRPELHVLLYVSAGISSLTTLFYLLCVRWTERRRAGKLSPANRGL